MAPSNQAQLNFVDSFQPAVLNLIASLPPGTGVFSPTCLVHCLSGQTTFQQLLVNGVSMAATLHAWWTGDASGSQVISPCQGWDCVNQCGVTYNGLPCNMGDKGCSPMTLPTETSDEPAPASVSATEGSLNGDQQAQMAWLQQQQQQQHQPHQQQQPQQQPQQQQQQTGNGGSTDDGSAWQQEVRVRPARGWRLSLALL